MIRSVKLNGLRNLDVGQERAARADAAEADLSGAIEWGGKGTHTPIYVLYTYILKYDIWAVDSGRVLFKN